MIESAFLGSIMSIVSARKERSAVIVAIGLFKLLKALLLIAVGAGALSLIHRDIAAIVDYWISTLRVDPDNELIHGAIAKLFSVTPKQLQAIGAGTFCYAALFLTEGVGLLLRKRWAEYFTVITTGALIPLEIYELVKRLTAIKVAVLIVNMAIVLYLIRRIHVRR